MAVPRRSPAFLLVLCCLIASLCAVPSLAADPCASFDSCSDCSNAADVDCGWCGDSSTCSSGSTTGPTNGTCSSWTWLPVNCPNDCSTNSNCSTCVSDGTSPCGWCADTQSCLIGDSSSPFSTSALCASWTFFTSSNCPTTQCDAATSCDACGNLPGCGWCASSAECVYGLSTGPTHSSCPTEQWYWATGSCPASDVCSSNTDCGDCVSQSTCGWCTEDNSCLTGTSNGPQFSSCSSGTWYWDTNSCPADSCAAYESCDACLGENCGWCASSATCSSGTESGPDFGSCDAWQYGSTTECQGECSDYNSCDECTAGAPNNCGWCTSTSTCSTGTSTGPVDGSCSGSWDWTTNQCSAEDPCTNYDGCGSCTAIGGCGWCGSADVCLTGTSSGPSSAACSGPWDWTNDECPAEDQCAEYTDCGSCTASTSPNDCGWCSSTSTCSTGTSTGPAIGTCSGEWDWENDQCNTPADSCNNYADCSSCIPASDCGWCTSTSTCSTGSSTGPNIGTCSGEWDWSSCSTDPCAGYTNCYGCTTGSPNDCGWCSTTETCSTGTGSGPSVGECGGDWDWSSSSCPYDACNSYSTCDTCTAEDGCGWCPTDNSCSSGTSSGPDSGSCPSWEWSSCQHTCSDNTDCYDCTTDSLNDCGWCESSSTCSAGNSNGPDAGSCNSDDWDWSSDSCPSVQCTDLGTCSQCTETGGCGWCESSSSCYAGDSSGPSTQYCSSGWDYGSCWDTQCSQHGSCSTCTQDSSDNCGWCSATDDCVSGTSSGPYGGSCSSSSWDFGPSSCSQHTCSDNTDCYSCTTDSLNDCGWCASSSTCSEGTSTGPSSGYCSVWEWTSGSCTACSDFGSCSDCVNAVGLTCGWCEDTDTCSAGSSSGPASGTCFSWDFLPGTCPAKDDSNWMTWVYSGAGILAFVILFGVVVSWCKWRSRRLASQDDAYQPVTDTVPPSAPVMDAPGSFGAGGEYGSLYSPPLDSTPDATAPAMHPPLYRPDTLPGLFHGDPAFAPVVEEGGAAAAPEAPSAPVAPPVVNTAVGGAFPTAPVSYTPMSHPSPATHTSGDTYAPYPVETPTSADDGSAAAPTAPSSVYLAPPEDYAPWLSSGGDAGGVPPSTHGSIQGEPAEANPYGLSGEVMDTENRHEWRPVDAAPPPPTDE